MMSERDAVELLRRAAQLGIDVWLDGGWGVDALLGEQTRSHYDLDVFVKRCDENAFVELLDVHDVRLLCERFDVPVSEEYRMAMGREA